MDNMIMTITLSKRRKHGRMSEIQLHLKMGTSTEIMLQIIIIIIIMREWEWKLNFKIVARHLDYCSHTSHDADPVRDDNETMR